MVRRLVALVVLLALMAGAAVVIGRIVLVPVAEGRVEEAVGRAFGAPAEVDVDPPLGLDLVRGAVGDVRVRLAAVTRRDVRVEDVDVRIVDAHVDLSALLGGSARVRFARIAFTGLLTEASLTTELRRRLGAAAVPGAARAAVVVSADGVEVRVPDAQPVAVTVRVAPTALLLDATGGDPVSSALAARVRGPVPLGRFPYGLRLTKVRPTPDALVLSGGRPGGRQAF